MTCALCAERGGAACGFETGFFEPDFQCGTVGLIRDLVYEGQTLPDGVDYRYCSDQKYATVHLDHIEDWPNAEHWKEAPLALWVSWYKNRGRTEAMWLLFSDKPPRPPTEQECLCIAQAYRNAGART